MPHHPPIPPPPKPTRIFFDPFNSSSTGHQRAESALAGSTSWRQSRANKLSHQFRDSSGRGGETHVSDLVGAGSKDWGKDGRKENGDWEKGAPGQREKGWQDITTFMSGSRKRSRENDLEDLKTNKRSRSSIESEEDKDKDKTITPTTTISNPPTASAPPDQHPQSQSQDQKPTTPTSPSSITPSPPHPPPQIFSSLTIYLNGSTSPLISDHKLKFLFLSHGGSLSLSLSRRTVTHVIIGTNCGGGLASSKIQKEIKTVRGKGMKYVTASWVVDCVERGRRLDEGGYLPQGLVGRIAGVGQGSLGGFWKKEGEGGQGRV